MQCIFQQIIILLFININNNNNNSNNKLIYKAPYSAVTSGALTGNGMRSDVYAPVKGKTSIFKFPPFFYFYFVDFLL